MKIVLFGASDITPLVADFLYAEGYDIGAIVTSAPLFKISYNPNGVKNMRHTDMHEWAQGKNIPVFDFTTNDDLLTQLSPLNPDMAIVAGWYHMVSKKVRDIFRWGAPAFTPLFYPSCAAARR